MLAECYQHGVGVPEDLRDQARREAATSVSSGRPSRLWPAQYRLGQCYENSESVEQSLVRAAHWYGLAARQGNVPAQYRLGLFYAEGDGVELNLKEARRWLEKAADQGHEEARKKLMELPSEPEPGQ